MSQLFQRRKRITTIGLFLTIFLLFVFGLEPLYKFFYILAQCLSEFNLNISRNAEEVKFYIWTHKDKIQYTKVKIGDSKTLLEAGFNNSYPIKITIHGFSDKGITSWTDKLRKHYFSVEDYNIITVDWESLAGSPWYNTACKNTRIVGLKTAEFIDWLVVDHFMSYEDVHVLGSSLGAHAAGYVGYFTGGNLARITGLDPSGPLFNSVTDMDRLDKSDAKFVDIIHTAGYWVGSSRAGGHVDIWPNGGLAPQPGCRNQESLDLSCSHFHAWKLFAESILLTKNKMPPLVGVKCENFQAFSSGACCFNNSVLVEIGDRINQSTRGNIFLKTKATYSGDYVLPPAQATNCDQLNNS